jgi:hypothetical protein
MSKPLTEKEIKQQRLETLKKMRDDIKAGVWDQLGTPQQVADALELMEQRIRDFNLN